RLLVPAAQGIDLTLDPPRLSPQRSLTQPQQPVRDPRHGRNHRDHRSRAAARAYDVADAADRLAVSHRGAAELQNQNRLQPHAPKPSRSLWKNEGKSYHDSSPNWGRALRPPPGCRKIGCYVGIPLAAAPVLGTNPGVATPGCYVYLTRLPPPASRVSQNRMLCWNPPFGRSRS